MKSLFEKIIGVKVPCDYGWEDENIVRIGSKRDIAAYAVGDFKGKCVIFLHGNGETAVSEKDLFEELKKNGVSVISPDYRGYGLTEGEFSERGCYEVAHAAYEWLRTEKLVNPADIISLGYSLGSGVAVELAASQQVGGLILQAPYYSGRSLLPYWVKRFGYVRRRRCWHMIDLLYSRLMIWLERSFASDRRLQKVRCQALVFHGSADMIIPISHGKKVFDGIVSRQKEFVRVENGNHNNFQYVMGFETYVETIVKFCMTASGGESNLLKGC